MGCSIGAFYFHKNTKNKPQSSKKNTRQRFKITPSAYKQSYKQIPTASPFICLRNRNEERGDIIFKMVGC